MDYLYSVPYRTVLYYFGGMNGGMGLDVGIMDGVGDRSLSEKEPAIDVNITPSLHPSIIHGYSRTLQDGVEHLPSRL